MPDYYVIATNIGEAKMANALALGIPLAITELALGDGEGAGARGTPVPNPEASALISERRRAPVNSFSVDPNNDNVLIAEQVIPETAGGWWIREMGLFDEDGDLIFVCNTPPTYKPQLSEGSGRTQVVRMAAIVSNTASVTLKVDPSVILATREYAQELVAVQAAELESLLDQRIAQIENYSFTQMGKGFDTNDSDAPITDNFAAWVHATVDYDAEDDEFIIFYNINPGHDISRNRVLLTKKAPDGVFSTPTVVADNTGVESLKTQAAGIAPNGDYLALVGVFNWGNSTPIRTDIYRSTNKGSTWSVTTMRDSSTNDPIIAYNGDVSGFLKLASGRIITLAVEPSPSFLTRIYYSDDNGASWTKASIAGDPTDVTEPGWVELPDGTIVCMARAAVRSGSTTSVIPAKFMLSYDSGVTWTEPVDSQSITDFTLSNGQMLLDEESKTVEFIHHSRFAQPDGFTSLYIATASYDDAKADRFSSQVRIGRLAAYVPIGDSSGDSGYVGAAKAANGVINAFYYNGLRNAAQINYAIGRRVAAQEREYFIDPITGEKAGTAGTGGGYQTVIYSGKLESYKPVAPVAEGLIVDTGVFRKNEGSLQFQLSAAGRAGAALLGGIDLTNVNSLNVSYDNLALDTNADFGIALYSIPNPSSATDNRVDLAASAELGPGVVSLDVSSLTGVYYPQMMLSNNTDEGGASEARAYEFWLEGPIKLGPIPSEPGINHSLYYRGNENPYLSNGWETGYTEGSPGPANFAEDRIVLTADGSTARQIQSVKTGLVDLTNVTMVEAVVDVDITNPAEADFGISIYNKATPTSALDGRVLFNYTKIEGRHKATLDVSSLSGDHYVFIVANANISGGAPGVTTGTIFDVRFY